MVNIVVSREKSKTAPVFDTEDDFEYIWYKYVFRRSALP
jgi:hypothetical protein